jgi:hypothetical protein
MWCSFLNMCTCCALVVIAGTDGSVDDHVFLSVGTF